MREDVLAIPLNVGVPLQTSLGLYTIQVVGNSPDQLDGEKVVFRFDGELVLCFHARVTTNGEFAPRVYVAGIGFLGLSKICRTEPSLRTICNHVSSRQKINVQLKRAGRETIAAETLPKNHHFSNREWWERLFASLAGQVDGTVQQLLTA